MRVGELISKLESLGSNAEVVFELVYEGEHTMMGSEVLSVTIDDNDKPHILAVAW